MNRSTFMKVYSYLIVFFVASWGALQAQDLHFTMFNMSPLTLNPAFTGSFEGTARVGGIYRDQWSSFISKEFVTPSFYVDVPLIRGLRKQDWLGVGMMMFNDQAGTAKLRNVGTMFSAAYHAGLGKDGRHLLTLGFQGGNVQRRIDLKSQDIKFEDELPTQAGGGGLGFGNGADRKLNENLSYMDFNAGLMLRSRLDDKNQLEAGLSFYHLTQPKYSLLSSPNQDGTKRPLRMALHARVQHRFSDLLYLEPTLLLQSTGGANEFGIQALAGYKINPDFTLRFGPGYRMGDAAQLIFGVDYQDLRVAASYDINVSSLSEVSNFQGGFEIAGYYILKIYKKPKISPAILCPQL